MLNAYARHLVPAIVGAALLSAACASDNPPVEPEYLPPAPTRDAGGSGDASVDTGPTLPIGIAASKEVCAGYIKCTAAATPASGAAAVERYGDASNCWKGNGPAGEAEAKICENSCLAAKAQVGESSRLAECGYAACAPAGNSLAVTNECDQCLRTKTGDRCCTERAKCAGRTPCDSFARATWARCGAAFGIGDGAARYSLTTCLEYHQSADPVSYGEFKAFLDCAAPCKDACHVHR
jgi:hypothetical protein